MIFGVKINEFCFFFVYFNIIQSVLNCFIFYTTRFIHFIF